MNNVSLVGNITRDPELRFLGNGTAIASFGLAITKKWKDGNGEAKEKTSFIECEAWGKSAENFVRYHKKGDKAAITGHLEMDSWEDKQTGQKRTKLKVVVDNFTFVNSKRDGEAKPKGKIDPKDVPGEEDEPPF